MGSHQRNKCNVCAIRGDTFPSQSSELSAPALPLTVLRCSHETPMNVAPAPKWRLKLLALDGEHEASRLFDDLRALLGDALQLREERPELHLIVTIPPEASEEDRNLLKQIASRLPLNSD